MCKYQRFYAKAIGSSFCTNAIFGMEAVPLNKHYIISCFLFKLTEQDMCACHTDYISATHQLALVSTKTIIQQMLGASKTHHLIIHTKLGVHFYMAKQVYVPSPALDHQHSITPLIKRG